MAKRDRIDDILQSWPYEPSKLGVRLVKARDRNVIQMRVDLGVLQLETSGRPDGQWPHGEPTYYDFLATREAAEQDAFALDERDCDEVDREFIQFYHRRICWLKLHRYSEATRDADHTLRLMDFCSRHSPSPLWTATHEQYRPFVLFQRTQAATLTELETDGPSAAVDELDDGAERIRLIYRQRGDEEGAEERELMERLDELRESLLGQFSQRDLLRKELQRAIASERYEDAARIRDELARIEQ